MQVFMTKAVTVLTALTSLVAGSVNDVRTVNTTTPMKWIGHTSKGINVTLYGNAAEITSQLKAIDPDWIPVTERPGYVAPNNILRSSELAVRSQSGSILCCPVSGQNFQPVNGLYVQDAANSLINLGGLCVVYPNSCVLGQPVGGPASCVNGAGIAVCNASPVYTISVDCASIGNYGNLIVNDCVGAPGNNFGTLCGQVFDDGVGDASGPFNIIVNTC